MQLPVESRSTPIHSLDALARRVRVLTGLVLFCYVATHLANHALGLVSLEAMETGRVWFLSVWRNPLGTVVLYGALIVHGLLSFWSLYQRRQFRIPTGEALHFLLGMAVPPLLVSHIIGTRLSHEWFATNDSYSYIILFLWKLRPDLGLKDVILLIVAWSHGCIALHYFLRFRPWYPRFDKLIFGMAMLIPLLALLGFVQAGREVSYLTAQSGWVKQTLQIANVPGPSGLSSLERVKNAVLVGYGIILIFTLVARIIRHIYERFYKSVRITYPTGNVVAVPLGFSVLEASRWAGIPHASVCGGHGRCSTCRIQVHEGLESLPPASVEEQQILNHIGAPPDVRLGCQLRPNKDLSATPLLKASSKTGKFIASAMLFSGYERETTVLFADLRGFTSIAENKLPYDVVFLLNQYFELVGDTIELAGGIANQFIGDGAMALFGLGTKPQEGCLQALNAACNMVHGLADLSRTLTVELKAPLKMGIGIHTGPAVVGHMGRGSAMYLTAVGDTVHVASRFQDLTKEHDCQLIISDLVAEQAGIDVSE
ncbi:MAG: adenylate/guanylate cyclase domain-containing protein [Deltaproteobacteria bacterium]|nr:adenylate/guanylate cyclase domain-containing protein [Deltaproteobacteria bacterium]